MTESAYQPTFEALRAILREFEPHLVVVHDDPGHYYLDTTHRMPNKKPLFFGSARVSKQYVSFHLMPVYVWPELLENASETLRKRMQGKSCFNFKRPEPEAFRELAELARSGFERYRQEGYV